MQWLSGAGESPIARFGRGLGLSSVVSVSMELGWRRSMRGLLTRKSCSIFSMLSSNGGFPATLAALNSTHSRLPKPSISIKVDLRASESAMSHFQTLTWQL